MVEVRYGPDFGFATMVASMVGVYVGFGAVAGMCVLWLWGPFTSPELVWAIGGEGLRNTIVLHDYYSWILDSAGEVQFGSWEPHQLGENGEPPSFQIASCAVDEPVRTAATATCSARISSVSRSRSSSA